MQKVSPGEAVCLKINRSVSHPDLCEFAHNLPSAIWFKRKVAPAGMSWVLMRDTK